VVLACKPSYSGGRDQEDQGSKPAWKIVSWDLILKNSFTKTELVEWFNVKALSSSPRTEKKKKEKKCCSQMVIKENWGVTQQGKKKSFTSAEGVATDHSLIGRTH
jgi:hypothetical protein